MKSFKITIIFIIQLLFILKINCQYVLSKRQDNSPPSPPPSSTGSNEQMPMPPQGGESTTGSNEQTPMPPQGGESTTGTGTGTEASSPSDVPPPFDPSFENRPELGTFYRNSVVGTEKKNLEHNVFVSIINDFMAQRPEQVTYQIKDKIGNKHNMAEYHKEMRDKERDMEFVMLDSMYIESFQDIILDLTPYITPEQLEHIQPELLEECYINGRLYCIPFSVEYGLLYARTDMLKRSNIKLDDINTWDKLLEACAKVKEDAPNSALYAYMGQFYGEYLVSNLMEWIYSFRDKDYNSGSIDFEGESTKEALDMVKQLMQKGFSSESKKYDEKDSAERWLSEEGLFLRHSPYIIQATRDTLSFEDRLKTLDKNPVVETSQISTTVNTFQDGTQQNVTTTNKNEQTAFSWEYRLLPGKYEGNSASTQTLYVFSIMNHVKEDAQEGETKIKLIIDLLLYASSHSPQTMRVDTLTQFPVSKTIVNETSLAFVNDIMKDMQIIKKPFRTKFYPEMSKKLQTLVENYISGETGYDSSRVIKYLQNMGKVHYVEFFSLPSIIILLITGLCIIFTIGVASHLVYFRSSKVIQRSSPIFGFLMVCGALLALCSIVLYIDKPSSVKCGLQPVALTLALALCFSSLLVKNYRIYRIFKNPNLRRLGTSISNSFLLAIVIVIVLIEAIILSVWLLQGQPMAEVVLDNSDTGYMIMKCTSNESITNSIFYVMIGFNGILFLAGIYLALKTRSVISEYNESKHIAFSIYTVLLCCIIWIPIILIKYSYNISFILKSTVILICSTTIISVMFVPKIVMLYKKPKNEFNFYDYPYNNGNMSYQKKMTPSDDYVLSTLQNNSNSNRQNSNSSTNNFVSHTNSSNRVSQNLDQTKIMRGLLPMRIEKNQLLLANSEWVNRKLTLIMEPKLMAVEAENADERDRKLISMVDLQIFCIEPLFSQNIIRIHIDNLWMDIQTPNAMECMKWKEAFEYGKQTPEPIWNEPSFQKL